MKCDYCKIHYEENEGVCPNCGMTPRKRWAKILCAVAEVVFWMVWIMMIPVAWGEARIGHPVIALVADILALPSSYYLIRRFLGRNPCSYDYPECLVVYHWFNRKISNVRISCKTDGRESFERIFCT